MVVVQGDIVVPLAGTWIEIAMISAYRSSVMVVPLAGTWIEIAIIFLIIFA